ncbi:MAG: hypothetical protein NZ890_09770 [Myxococcota bacterium]|nr:hypothetical protein [Myxococcota bacterium]
MTAGNGDRLGGRYQVVKELGRWRLGRVVGVVDAEQGRRCVLKLVWPHPGRDAAFRERVQEVGQRLMQFRHPAWAEVYRVHAEEDLCGWVMEWVEGTPLLQALGWAKVRGGVRGIGEQLLDALEAAHRAGWVHGGLHPGQVFLVEVGAGEERYPYRLKLVGLGTAALLGEQIWGQEVDLHIRGYLPPEYGTGQVHVRSDVYGAGAILYALHRGMAPYGDGPPDDAPLPLNLPSAHEEAAICQALRVNPARRPGSIEELRQMLWPEAGQSQTKTPHPAGQKPQRGRLWRMEVLPWALGLLLVTLVVAVLHGRRPRPVPVRLSPVEAPVQRTLAPAKPPHAVADPEDPPPPPVPAPDRPAENTSPGPPPSPALLAPQPTGSAEQKRPAGASPRGHHGVRLTVLAGELLDKDRQAIQCCGGLVHTPKRLVVRLVLLNGALVPVQQDASTDIPEEEMHQFVSCLERVKGLPTGLKVLLER